MLRKRILAVLAGLALLVGAGFGAAQLAQAAIDDPALTGQRVWCIDANGLPHYLPAPCKQYKGMWYFGNGANLYQGTGPSGTTPDVSALVKSEVAKQLAASGAGSATTKHKIVTFDADWNTNPEIHKVASQQCPSRLTQNQTTTGVPSSLTANGAFLQGAVPVSAVTEGFTNIGTANPSNTTNTNKRWCFTIVATGLPKYSASQAELWNSNVSATTMASESDVTVLGEYQPNAGETTRTFAVSIDQDPTVAFGNSRQFTVDVWTLVLT